ncbi:MAG: type II toxin-antitoxin system HipA family toxin [Steroidobacteraceae bacterium]
MMLLDVWLRLPDADTVQIGELAFGDADVHGHYECEFRYVDKWLRDARAFALDPESLPLQPQSWHSGNLHPPLGVFEDALPDEWGRSLLVAAMKLPHERQGAPFLLRALGADGLGALRFVEGGQPLPARHPGSVLELAALLDAAARFERGEQMEEPGYRRLLEAGPSPGGARPKALIDDGDNHWIAKFPSRQRDGRFDVVGLEATTMRLAARAGLDVPETRLERVGASKVLLVRRFDIAATGGRRHMISFKTLCRESPGRYVLAYSELATTLRKHSSTPDADVSGLFRQMVFNAVIGNTDDHLKNFWMYHHDAGFRLTPAFDLVPDVGERGEHVLIFVDDRRPPARRALLDLARPWGVPDAGAIIDEVRAAASGFHAAATETGVPQTDIAHIGADIARRLARVG